MQEGILVHTDRLEQPGIRHQMCQVPCEQLVVLVVLCCVLQEVSSIVDLLPVPEGDSGCLISTSWLEGWVNGEEAPEPIDNSVLLCEHQRLSPLLPAGALKFISDTAWQELTVSSTHAPHSSCCFAFVQHSHSLVHAHISGLLCMSQQGLPQSWAMLITLIPAACRACCTSELGVCTCWQWQPLGEMLAQVACPCSCSPLCHPMSRPVKNQWLLICMHSAAAPSEDGTERDKYTAVSCA